MAACTRCAVGAYSFMFCCSSLKFFEQGSIAMMRSASGTSNSSSANTAKKPILAPVKSIYGLKLNEITLQFIEANKGNEEAIAVF